MASLQDSNLLVLPGSIVVVTGVNGFIASHIVDQLLQRGYRVRGTVRDVSRNQWVAEYFEKAYGADKFELVEVRDMSAVDVYDDIVRGASGFVHVASPLMDNPDPDSAIKFATDSALRCLEAAAKEPGMQRVVLTSSSGACVEAVPNKVFTVDANSWNEWAVEAAYAGAGSAKAGELAHLGNVYAASKTRSEQAAWRWMRERSPGFALNTVIPNANIGPPLDAAHQATRSTVNWIAALLHMSERLHPDQLPGFRPQHYVDVRDDAAVHVAALVYADVAGERLFAFSAPFNWSDLLRIAKKNFPDRRFGDEIPGEGKDLSKVANERAEQLLERLTGHGWRSLEDAVVAAANSLLG
ncbi:aldehyde reductase [Hypoxylon sp. FL1284]|nr:aldehyde reductase [Hypoxylon sp. FL1284]